MLMKIFFEDENCGSNSNADKNSASNSFNNFKADFPLNSNLETQNSINSIMTTVDVLVAFRAVIHFAFSEEKNGTGAWCQSIRKHLILRKIDTSQSVCVCLCLWEKGEVNSQLKNVPILFWIKNETEIIEKQKGRQFPRHWESNNGWSVSDFILRPIKSSIWHIT